MPIQRIREKRTRELSLHLKLQVGESLLPLVERALPVIEKVSPIQATIFRAYYGFNGDVSVPVKEIAEERGTTTRSVRQRLEKPVEIMEQMLRTLRSERDLPGAYGSWPPNAFVTMERALAAGTPVNAAWQLVHIIEYELKDLATVDELCELTERRLRRLRRMGDAGIAGLKAMLARIGKKLDD